MSPALEGEVIFSPGELVRSLALELTAQGLDVTLASPFRQEIPVKQLNPDSSQWREELEMRDLSESELLSKHPLSFITLGRQLQSELLAEVFAAANRGEFDLVHVYMNEEELGLAFAGLCTRPVVFTHHEPYNFLRKYQSQFAKYAGERKFISLSVAQRSTAPKKTQWVGNAYHGLPADKYSANLGATEGYIAYLGRIIRPKGVHLAIQAAKKAGVRLKMAGKHYGDTNADAYWKKQIEPQIDGDLVDYVGFLATSEEKQAFLQKAAALVVPSTWEEPFGMVSIEALACGTPVIGFDRGATKEIITRPEVGKIVAYREGSANRAVDLLAGEFNNTAKYDRQKCRQEFEARFTIDAMAKAHIEIYQQHAN